MTKHVDPNHPRAAFTLVEVLAVVLILGVLAAVTVPRLTAVARDVTAQAAEINRAQLQRAVVRYYQEHGQYPSVDRFHDQLTLASNRKGETAEIGTEGFAMGPYLLVVPTNPLTSGNIVGDGPSGPTDWLFDPHTGRVDINRADDSAEDRVVHAMQVLIGPLLNYTREHDGRLPASLHDLSGAYLSASALADALRHPVTGENPGFTLANGGDLLAEIGDPDTTPILHEIRYGRVYADGLTGYADGHVGGR